MSFLVVLALACLRFTVATVAGISAFLHARQHPHRASCRTSRLLILHYPPDVVRGDGLAQLLLRIVLGLGEAVVEERTLIWGAEVPLLFGDSRDVWHSRATWDDGAGLVVNCSNWRGGGGAWNCLYEQLSSCSLADVAPAELAALGHGGFRDAARVRVQESRRGAAAFVPPPQFRGTSSSSGAEVTARHQWAGALAAYVTRLAVPARAVFEARRSALGLNGPYWSIHVRHGDVAAAPATYGSRRVFPFRTAFDAVDAAAAAAVAPGGRGIAALPAAVYVASDAATTEAAVRLARRRLAAGAAAWPAGARRPRVVAASRRLRTAGGTHTAAFADASSGRAEHLMRVLVEAAEDLYLLGGGELLVGQGCSGFSALAALLVAAGTDGAAAGSAPPTSPIFLDAAQLVSGELQAGFVPGQFMTLSRAAADRGAERWSEWEARLTAAPMRSFVPGGGRDGDDAIVFERAIPAAPRPGFAPDGLPYVSIAVFDAAARCWAAEPPCGDDDACPRLLPEASDGGAATIAVDALTAAVKDADAPATVVSPIARAALLMRRGMAWSKRIPAVAFACWEGEAAALDACASAGCAAAEAVAQARADVDARVMRLAREHLSPYALPAADVAALLKANVGVV